MASGEPRRELPVPVADVDADGGGDDAAVGSADDPHLLRDRRHRPRQRRGGGAPAGARGRLSHGLGGRLGCLRRRRRARAVAGRRRRSPAMPPSRRSALPASISSAASRKPASRSAATRSRSCSRAGAAVRSRILRLGAEQGVWCLGCCWALMLVMFAVGTMNIFWMALVGLFTVVEKQTSGSLATRLAGAILLVWATALLLVSR